MLLLFFTLLKIIHLSVWFVPILDIIFFIPFSYILPSFFRILTFLQFFSSPRVLSLSHPFSPPGGASSCCSSLSSPSLLPPLQRPKPIATITTGATTGAATAVAADSSSPVVEADTTGVDMGVDTVTTGITDITTVTTVTGARQTARVSVFLY